MELANQIKELEYNTIERQNNLVSVEKQNNFLETMLGRTINTGLDIGIRLALPDFIENQVIEIKDELLKHGVKAGIDKAIQSISDIGKSAIGIVTGKFDSISQIQSAVEKGGTIDIVSGALEQALNFTSKKGILPNTVTTLLKNSKNVILDNISSNIEKTLTNQIKAIELLQKYTQNWKQYYEQKDFNGMEKEYTKMKEKLKVTMPLETTIKTVRQIENLHTLIKNKGKNFEISTEEMALAKQLA